MCLFAYLLPISCRLRLALRYLYLGKGKDSSVVTNEINMSGSVGSVISKRKMPPLSVQRTGVELRNLLCHSVKKSWNSSRNFEWLDTSKTNLKTKFRACGAAPPLPSLYAFISHISTSMKYRLEEKEDSVIIQIRTILIILSILGEFW